MSRPLICAVIVLYRERAEDSIAIRSLQQVLERTGALADRLFICVYDNSAEPALLPPDLFACNWASFQPRRNTGLAVAYNAALDVANQHDIAWLLLLDSDTEVTADYLENCIRVCGSNGDRRVAAVIPHIVEGHLIHAPRFCRALRRSALPLNTSGVFAQELIAMNSGSVLRVSALNEIGGFNPAFWLDYLDYWLFRRLYAAGYRVYVLPEKLEHSLSFADPAARMPLERYRNMLAAEDYFTAKFGSAWEKLRLRLVLLKRMAKFAAKPNSRLLFLATMKQLFSTASKPPVIP